MTQRRASIRESRWRLGIKCKVKRELNKAPERVQKRSDAAVLRSSLDVEYSSGYRQSIHTDLFSYD